MAEVPNNEKLVTDINPDIQEFLSHEDIVLDSGEAKKLWSKYDQAKMTLEQEDIGMKNWIIDISKDNLVSLRKALGVEKSSADEKGYVTGDEWNKINQIANSETINLNQEVSDDPEVSFGNYMTAVSEKVQGFVKETIEDWEENFYSTPQLVTQLQIIIGARADGRNGPGTQAKLIQYIEDNQGIDSLADILLQNDLENFEYDKPMKSREQFISTYGEGVSYLEDSFDCKGEIFAIAEQESNSGQNLVGENSLGVSGAEGIMQLTNSCFDDMQANGVTAADERFTLKIQEKRIAEYQDVFSKIDFTVLKSMDNGRFEETLPKFLWQKLESVSTSTPQQAKQILGEFQDIIKSGKAEVVNYLHTLNIIIGAVYYTYIKNHRSKGNSQLAMRNYNGDKKEQVTLKTDITLHDGVLVEKGTIVERRELYGYQTIVKRDRFNEEQEQINKEIS